MAYGNARNPGRAVRAQAATRGRDHVTETLHFGSCDPGEVWPLIRDHHYSHRMPSNIQHTYCWRSSGGLFGEHGPVVAAAMFSIPPTRWSEDLIELTRLVRAPDVAMPLSAM